MTVTRFLRTLATRLAWIGIAALIALGGAGIVATMNHVPGTDARAELTWAADQAVEPALDLATDDLQALSDQVDQLGDTARRALSQMVAGDLPALRATIDEGSTGLGSVQARAADLDASLAAVPYTGDDWKLFLAPDLHLRYDELSGTRGLASGLEDDWAAFTGRALDAATLTGLLARHDEETAAAARVGSAAHYQQALALLDAPDATLVKARAIRDRLAASTDVATLTAWIDRNGAYDAALRTLYGSLQASKGRVTPTVRKAFDDEQAARAQLPGDTRGLVVIMSDIAQGGLNQAVIAIEQARGSLAAALEVQQQLREGAQLPG